MTARLLHGAAVVTMDPARPQAAALGIDGDRIAAVGSREEVRAALRGPLRELDLGGGALLPGFIDAHHHACQAAFTSRSRSLDLPAGSSLDELLAQVAAEAARDPDASWVRMQGYDHHKLDPPRAPSREELDAVVPDRPALLIAYSFHEGVLNSAGLEAMGWSASTRDPVNGFLAREPGGWPAGEVAEAALFAAEAASRQALLPTAAEAWLAEIEVHCRRLLAAGITRVGDAAVAPEFEALYEGAEGAGRLPLTVHRMPVASSMIEPRLAGPPTGEGPSGAPVGPAKLFLDGADRCAVCLSGPQVARAAGVLLRRAATGGGLAAVRAALRLRQPARLSAGPHVHQGMRFWDREPLREAIARAGERGFQVAQHAMGNEAIALALDALEGAGAALAGRPGRPRLEHFTMADERLARRAADAGAVAVMQPFWAHEIGDLLHAFPLPAPFRVLPLASVRRAGAVLAGSSDYPVASYDVLGAVQAAVVRRTARGAPLEPAEALTVAEALEAYTLGGAIALGVEGEAGVLRAGARADLVQLGADPLATDAEAIADIPVRATWVGGRRAHPAG